MHQFLTFVLLIGVKHLPALKHLFPMCNLHTIITMNVKIRKFVTLVALVSFVVATISCANNDAKPETEVKKPNFNKVFSKKKKTANETATPDSTLGQDSLSSVDFNLAAKADTSIADTAFNQLPIPENETDIDWEASAEADTLTGDNDKAHRDIEEDLADETDETFEEEMEYDESEEFVNYSSGDGTLSKERILGTELIQVQFPELIDERDSVLAVIEERMTLTPDQVSKQIVVEKWYSPVNYRGYKFNRKKLMIYGLEKAAPVDVYFYLGEYYFSVHKKVYYLNETAKNKDFTLVKDSVLATYLLSY